MKRTVFITALVAAGLPMSAMAQASDPAQPAPGINFLSTWDLDEDGKITVEELKERRSDLFASFDENEDGAMSVEEFEALNEARLAAMQRPTDRGNGVGRAEQALMWDAVDANKDGKIPEDEFIAAASGWMSVMDGNGDGVLTVDDFGPGARQNGGGQGQGQGQGRATAQAQAPQQGMAQGRGQGGGKGQGQGQGQQGHGRMQAQDQMVQQGNTQGRGQGRGQGQGRKQAQDQTSQQGNAQGRGQSQGRGRMQAQDQMAQHGKSQDRRQGGGKGNNRSQATAAYQAFTTETGALWIVDSRTGDVLLCQSTVDSNAPAGFVPVCIEATR